MKIKTTKIFNRELKKLAKKHFPVESISLCLNAIINNDTKTLIKIKNHSLQGKWKGCQEFHPARIGNYSSSLDKWIVVYKINNRELTLLLVATGNHDILN